MPEMKLWLLRPIEGLPMDEDPWTPWYDKAFGFVVRAETEEAARLAVVSEAGDEMHPRTQRRPPHTFAADAAWSPRYSTCVELTADGEPGVIIRDFASA